MTSRPNSFQETDSQLSLSEELLAETYDALRRIASRQLSRQSSTPSLNTTLIVHEAWLKLAGDDERRFNDRNHYLATAARAMRWKPSTWGNCVPRRRLPRPMVCVVGFEPTTTAPQTQYSTS